MRISLKFVVSNPTLEPLLEPLFMYLHQEFSNFVLAYVWP
jgi:hypothetical protein